MRIYWVVFALTFAGCHGVIRDSATYNAEVGFMSAAALQGAESLMALVARGCKCVDGKFIDPVCESAAKRALVVRARVPWHKAMMLYNARLADDRPAVDPPTVPSPSTLCP